MADTKQTTILWTALPHGLSEENGKKYLNLSVFASIRLYNSKEGDVPLFPNYDEIMDWTGKVKSGLKFHVVFDGGPTIGPDAVEWDSSKLDPSLWKKIFTAKTSVTPYLQNDAAPDYHIVSYPAKTIQDFVTAQYTDIAIQYPDHFPEPAEVNTRFEKLNMFSVPAAGGRAQQPVRATLRQNFIQKLSGMSARLTTSIGNALDRVLESGATPLKPETESALQVIAQDLHTSKYTSSEPGNFAKAVAQFALFHASQNTAKSKAPSTAKLAIPSFEFHEGLSQLGEYPELMKVLGLIVDLKIPYATNPPSGTSVYVVPQWSAAFKANTLNLPGKTRLDTTSYWPAPDATTSDIKNGLLDLSNAAKFDVVQLDLDGAVFKLMNMERTLVGEEQQATEEKPVLLADAGPPDIQSIKPITQLGFLKAGNAALPSLRTTGLSVVKVNRPAALVSLINQTANANKTVVHAQANPSAVPKATASNVMLIFNSPQVQTTWTADQLIRGYRIDIWDSETKKWNSLCKRIGTYKVGNQIVTLPADEGCVSLAISKPGDNSQNIERLSEALFKWDGWSLVAPRPGKLIRDTESPVDTNNLNVVNSMGVSVTFTPPAQSLPKLRFGMRYRIRARVVDLAGNSRTLAEFANDDFQHATPEKPYLRYEPVSSPSLVYRTKNKPGESIENIIIRSNYDTTSDDYDKKNSLKEYPTERHVVAPRTSETIVEMHGKFDGMTPHESYDLIANQKDSAFGMPNDPNKPTPLPGSQGVLIPGETVTVPYLPDPLAQGATLRFYDKEWKLLWSIETHTFYDSAVWPNPRSFRLRVAEGDGKPQWEADGPRILTVYVPKAGFFHVRYSCSIQEDDLSNQALWKMVEDRDPSNFSDLKKTARNGLHWMLTPFREMTIVHAVQQPLQEPKFDKLVPIKDIVGGTYALLHARITNDAKSTARLDVRATWDEPVDDLLAKKWTTLHGEAHVFDLSVTDKDDTLTVGEPETPAQHEGGVAAGEDQTLKLHAVLTADKKSVKGQKSIVLGPGKVSGVFDVKKHEFGDTKYRKVKYTAVATTRFRENFLDLIDPEHYAELIAPPGTQKNVKKLALGDKAVPQEKNPAIPLTRETSVEVKVLNSARPALPKILYVIPVFEWERKEDDGSIIRRRCGGGFRVYMDRPWYSSGDEEMLGVVIARDHSIISADDHPMKTMVTQWGLDPIWKSAGKMKSAPTLADFPAADRKQNGVTLEERPKDLVDIAGFQVLYDEDRRLWYSDIFINPGQTYFPFVRLGLVRYQPNSIANCFISRVVLTDFVQVIPDRVAAVTYESPQKIKIQVAGVFGLSKDIDIKELEKTPAELLSSAYMTATLERHATDGDLGWIPLNPKQPPNPMIMVVDPEAMIPEKVYSTKMLWSKEFNLTEPLKNPRGQNGLRVVIKEYEKYQGQNNQIVPRLIYADAIEL
jgi:hypothetical protein